MRVRRRAGARRPRTRRGCGWRPSRRRAPASSRRAAAGRPCRAASTPRRARCSSSSSSRGEVGEAEEVALRAGGTGHVRPSRAPRRARRRSAPPPRRPRPAVRMRAARTRMTSSPMGFTRSPRSRASRRHLRGGDAAQHDAEQDAAPAHPRHPARFASAARPSRSRSATGTTAPARRVSSSRTHGQGHRAGERIAAEGRAVAPGREVQAHLLGREQRADGEAAAERLRRRHAGRARRPPTRAPTSARSGPSRSGSRRGRGARPPSASGSRAAPR